MHKVKGYQPIRREDTEIDNHEVLTNLVRVKETPVNTFESNLMLQDATEKSLPLRMVY